MRCARMRGVCADGGAITFIQPLRFGSDDDKLGGTSVGIARIGARLSKVCGQRSVGRLNLLADVSQTT